MDAVTIQLLLTLNRQFYQTFASPFSATRQRIQPGVQKMLPMLLSSPHILDLGCGNGELGCQLMKQGFTGNYTGMDFSLMLLKEAQRRLVAGLNIHLVQGDLSEAGWETQFTDLPFQTIVAFAVLHHLPGETLRLAVAQTVRGLSTQGGFFIVSNWQFLNSPRLRARIQPWETVGLTHQQVDAGDYLLDWRYGGKGLRYVHHFTPAELEAIARAAGFAIQETFYADGENGQLGLYQIWKAV